MSFGNPRAEEPVRARIPSNYFCKSCGTQSHHWIMDCSLLSIFRASTEGSKRLTSGSFEIHCSERSIQCQSVHRIIVALQFYHAHHSNDGILTQYLNRYKHLVTDWNHLLAAHLSDDTETNDTNFAMIHARISTYLHCELPHCPHTSRSIRVHVRGVTAHNPALEFFRQQLDTIHCFFLHPYYVGFKIVKTRSYLQKHPSVDHSNDDHKGHDDDNVEWVDDELTQLRRDLNSTKTSAKTSSKPSTNQNKFVIETSESSGKQPINESLGERYYYWNWYKSKDQEDWRFNPSKTFAQLYIPPKYRNIKAEIIQNNIATLSPHVFDSTILYKAEQYLAHSQEIRRFRSKTNELLHYNVSADRPLSLCHVVALILYTDCKALSMRFRDTFRRASRNTGTETNDANDANDASDSESCESKFKARHAEFHFWARYLREAVELYGTSVADSKLERYYTAFSHQVMLTHPCFHVRLCMPMSCSAQLQMMGMTTTKGYVVELSRTMEVASFYPGLLKYFRCALLSKYAEDDELLFVGGLVPMQVSTIRWVSDGVDSCHDYEVFVRAMLCFNAVLDAEEEEDVEEEEVRALRHGMSCYSGHMVGRSGSHMTRNNSYLSTRTDSMCSTWSVRKQRVKQEETSLDGKVIKGLCQEVLNTRRTSDRGKGFPRYMVRLFKQRMKQRDHIIVSVRDLQLNKAFRDLLLGRQMPGCELMVRFDVLCKLFRHCKVISVDMGGLPTSTKWWMMLCKQMVHCADEKSELQVVIMSNVKKEADFPVYDKMEKKYRKCKGKLWFRCLRKWRYSKTRDLQMFFDIAAHDAFVKKGFGASPTSSPKKEGNTDVGGDDDDQKGDDPEVGPTHAQQRRLSDKLKCLKSYAM